MRWSPWRENREGERKREGERERYDLKSCRDKSQEGRGWHSNKRNNRCSSHGIRRREKDLRLTTQRNQKNEWSFFSLWKRTQYPKISFVVVSYKKNLKTWLSPPLSPCLLSFKEIIISSSFHSIINRSRTIMTLCLDFFFSILSHFLSWVEYEETSSNWILG